MYYKLIAFKGCNNVIIKCMKTKNKDNRFDLFIDFQ